MKISVILTTYNRGKTYLRQAIQSVVDQTYKNWELIIFDNYSTDNTDEIVREFSKYNIKYNKLQNNGIIARSRNAAIKLATGEYIALIDSDDYWENNKLAVSCKYLSKNNDDGFCHAENWLFSDGRNMIKKYGPEKRFLFNNLLTQGNCLSPSATLIKREILNQVGGYSEKEKFITAEDYDLWLKISKKDYRLIFSEKVLGSFRVHSGAESYDVKRNTTAAMNVIQSHFNETDLDIRCLHEALGNNLLTAGKTCQIRGKYKDALRMYIKSAKFKLSPKVGLLIFSLMVPYTFFVSIYNLFKSRKI